VEQDHLDTLLKNAIPTASLIEERLIDLMSRLQGFVLRYMPISTQTTEEG
jgi:hypothetical protein